MSQWRVAERAIPTFILMWVAVVLIGLPATGSAAEVVVPNAQTTARGNGNNVAPFSCGIGGPSMRYQQVYAAAEVGSGAITQIAFRQFNSLAFTGTLLGVTLRLSSTSNGPDTLSSTFDANVGADVKTVFSGDLTLSGSDTPFNAPGPFDARIPLKIPFTFDAGTGKNLLLDVTIPACGPTGIFEAISLPGDSVSRVYALTSAATTAVVNDTLGLITQFTVTAAGPPPPPTTLVAAVLPSSRSVQVGTTATAFVTIINAGPNTAFAVGISLASAISATFTYAQTSCATNAVIAADKVPADIGPSAQACYVISITPTAPLDPTEVAFNFAGTNTDPVTTLIGINTLLMSASSTPVPDIVALAATATGDGILHLPGPAGVGAFAVATSNVGIGGRITASANTGSTVLPLALLICQTDPVIGTCISPIGPSVSVQINAGAIATFAIFATASGTIVLDPAANRIFVVFADDGSVVRGRTSVAVSAQ